MLPKGQALFSLHPATKDKSVHWLNYLYSYTFCPIHFSACMLSSVVQWNPALWQCHKYSHLMYSHFILAQTKVRSAIFLFKEPLSHPVNTARFLWPIGHQIIGVPLYCSFHTLSYVVTQGEDIWKTLQQSWSVDVLMSWSHWFVCSAPILVCRFLKFYGQSFLCGISMVPFSRSSGIIILIRYSKQTSLLTPSYNHGQIALENLQKHKIIWS